MRPLIRTTHHLAFWLALVLVTPACEVTEESAPYYGDGGVVTRALPTRAFEIRDQGRKVGSLVRYDEEGSERFFFSVRNIHDQDLGLVDAQGQAWRRRPFEEDEALSSGTVQEGAARILGLAGSVTLFEVDLDGLRATPSAGR
jgi:hypothetical protein